MEFTSGVLVEKVLLTHAAPVRTDGVDWSGGHVWVLSAWAVELAELQAASELKIFESGQKIDGTHREELPAWD